MADTFWSASVGANIPEDVTGTATTTAGAPFEFRATHTGTGVTRQGALLALEAIKLKIIEGQWPPGIS
jgi:hypothetical protein